MSLQMQYDIIIVGGGLVGAGLAIALRDVNMRVALIDARMPKNDDSRFFALNKCSCRFLMNLGLWSKLSPQAAPIHQVHVSNKGYFGTVRLNCNDVRLNSLGHVIPARLIEAVLNEELMAISENVNSNFKIYRPATLTSLQQQAESVTVEISTTKKNEILHSPIVIGADGTRSTVRSQLNIPTTTDDYGQSALVCRTMLQRSHHHIAYERFNGNEVMAMLPLAGEECATIWTASHKKIAQLMLLSDEDFLPILQKEFGYRLGRLQQISPRSLFPLQRVRAEQAVQQGVMLLGNSAHTLHPIAAQGFNIALYEVAALVEKIKELKLRHKNLTPADLLTISQDLQQQLSLGLGLSHHLSHLFSSNSFIVNSILQLGLLGLDLVSPIKKKFLEKILYQKGHIPPLLLSTNNDEIVQPRH
jgi:2-octaprenyl-6-methoxyphenol hydroxylase